MRTLKFRVFYNGKMIYPKQLLCYDGEIKSCFYSDNEVPQIKGPNNETGYEIMQFTGKLDKNGKECYEGDIVSGYPYGGSIKQNGFIEWDTLTASFIAKFPTGVKLLCDIANTPEPTKPEDYSFEIVGNVFENPELTK